MREVLEYGRERDPRVVVSGTVGQENSGSALERELGEGGKEGTVRKSSSFCDENEFFSFFGEFMWH